jgi:hypothetical protein
VGNDQRLQYIDESAQREKLLLDSNTDVVKEYKDLYSVKHLSLHWKYT